MDTITTISFDLDGTLVDSDFTSWVWEREIPELYARRHAISIEEATSRIIAAYAAVGDESLLWYDLSYWFDLFDLPGSWLDLLHRHKHRIALFPEVLMVLERLHQDYNLIVASNAARPFVDMEIEATGIGPYFSRIVSATSDFHQVKKSPDFYQRLCSLTDLAPETLLHVGDHLEHDYHAPRLAGITAYYLDRNGAKEPEQANRIGTLNDLVRILAGKSEQ